MPPPLPPSQTAALHHTRIGCGPGRQSGHEVARVCDVSGEGGGCGGVGGGQVDLPLLVAHAAGEVPAGAQEEAARAGRQGRGRVRAWGGEAVPWKVQSWCKQYSPEVRQLLAPVLLLLLPPPAGLPTVPRPAPALPPHPCTPTRTRTHLLAAQASRAARGGGGDAARRLKDLRRRLAVAAGHRQRVDVGPHLQASKQAQTRGCARRHQSVAAQATSFGCAPSQSHSYCKKPCIPPVPTHLLRGGYEVGGHLDLLPRAVQQLGGGHEVLGLAAGA